MKTIFLLITLCAFPVFGYAMEFGVVEETIGRAAGEKIGGMLFHAHGVEGKVAHDTQEVINKSAGSMKLPFKTIPESDYIRANEIEKHEKKHECIKEILKGSGDENAKQEIEKHLGLQIKGPPPESYCEGVGSAMASHDGERNEKMVHPDSKDPVFKQNKVFAYPALKNNQDWGSFMDALKSNAR